MFPRNASLSWHVAGTSVLQIKPNMIQNLTKCVIDIQLAYRTLLAKRRYIRTVNFIEIAHVSHHFDS